MENFNDKTEKKRNFDKALYTKVVWAGRRRYYFDILATRGGDKYISITESKKRTENDEKPQFDNQKIFLFKEDFGKFHAALEDVLEQLGGVDNICDFKPEDKMALVQEELPAEEKLYSADDIDFDSL